jgi:hypothetical protein
LPLGVVHLRELLLGDGALVVVDRLSGGGRHTVELRYPFADAHARLRSLSAGEQRALAGVLAGAELQASDPTAVDVDHAVEIGPDEAPIAVLAVASRAPLAAAIEPTLYSPGYGERVDAAAAVFSARLDVPATLVTVILPLAAP